MIQRIFTILFFALILQGCAKIGKPTGGPKDVMPPEFIGANPENRSTNFNADKIDLEFNEYLQLKDQNREIIISPPMKEKPVVRIRDKSVRITFNEKLAPATTYTVNFGKSLSDLNESNPLPDFEYVFSTGDHVDSLAVSGRVTDAFTHKPDQKSTYLVMLYENLSDSAPLVEIPKYYGKTNEFGLFSINNIAADTFRLIALNDLNNDMKFQPGVESMAFLDSFLVINPANVSKQSFIKDTVKIITGPVKGAHVSRHDTTKADTVIAPGKIINTVDVSMFYFTEENNKVLITDKKRESNTQFSFVFNRPLYDDLKIRPLNFTPDSDWYILEKSVSGDTLTYWVKDLAVAKHDTFKLQLNYLTADSSGIILPKTDTLTLKYQPKLQRGSGRRSKEEDKKEDQKTEIMVSISPRSAQHLNKPLDITASKPIASVNLDSILFFKMVDTVYLREPFKLQMDSALSRKYHLYNKWEEDTKYKLFIAPGAFKDIYGFKNDTVEVNFSTQREDFYGKILLTFESAEYPMIIQVVDEKGIEVRSKETSKPGLITFDFLPPAKYSFKAIYDRNKNGKWDTGNYLKHIQPETIYLSGSPQQLRSNWDWDQTWKITE